MLVRVGNFIRMLTRPLITAGLLASTVQRLMAGDVEGAKFLGTFFGIAMTFWFADRQQQNRPADNGDK